MEWQGTELKDLVSGAVSSTGVVPTCVEEEATSSACILSSFAVTPQTPSTP